MYINVYIHNICYIYIYCISSNWHRISLWREGDRGRCPFCTTFQKLSLLLNIPPLFSPSIKINLAHFFFMCPLFLHGCRRHWKKGSAHREILQISLAVCIFRGTIKTYLKNHISLLYLSKIMPCAPPSCQICPSLILFCPPSGVDCSPPSYKPLCWKSKLLGLK